jgi:uncharacterized repeat protein (TIGR03847 family)
VLEAQHDLGRAGVLKPEALGQPGHRTFRFNVEAERGSAHIWVEKGQMSALAEAIQKFLEETKLPPPSRPRTGQVETLPEPFYELRAASLGLAYDEGTGLFAVLAYTQEDFQEDRATVILWASKAQVEAMAEESLHVVSAGRPVCPLCKQPMDPEGHACVRSNGHHKSGIEEL